MKRPRGRPAGAVPAPAANDMLSAALNLLDSQGIEGFTMRSLAHRLGVTPMAIYHHFGDRDGLIAAMADRVYGAVAEPAEGQPLQRIEALLRSYHATVLRHPGLTLLIFRHPTAFPEQARRITENLARLLLATGLSERRTLIWVGILVDFTHGAAVAAAMASRAAPEISSGDVDFGETLKELLAALGGQSLTE